MKTIQKLFSHLHIPDYIYMMVMLCLTFQIFEFLPIFQRSYIFWFFSIVIACKYSTRYFVTKEFFWLIIYLLIVLFNYLIGDYYFLNPTKVLDEFIFLFIPATMAYYIFQRNNIDFIKVFIIFFGVFLIESSLVSYYANSIFPGIMRLQSNTLSVIYNSNILTPFQSLGMSDYSLPHSIPVIIPGLVYASITCKSKWIKCFLITLIFTSLLLAYASESFTALMFSIFSLLLSLIIDVHNRNKTIFRIIIIGIIVVPMAMIESLQLFMLEELQSLFADDSIAYKKINDIQDSIYYGGSEGDVENRQVLYDLSMTAIKDHLILGTDIKIGGHSSFIDRLATLGLIGFVPLVLFVIFQIKSTLCKICGTAKYYYYIGILFALLMMFFKNMSCWSMWLFLLVILPCCLMIKSRNY